MDTTVQRNTIGGMVAPGPLAWAPPPPPRKQRWLLAIAPIVLLVVAVIGLSFLSVPYVALAPGQADEISTSLSVPEDRNNPPRGEILITTVSLKQATVLDVFFGWLDDDTDVFPEADLFGEVDPEQYTRNALQDMQDAKQHAVVVALRRLGFPVTEHGEGTLVTNLAGPTVPVAGVIQPGDTITAIDGEPTLIAGELVRILQAKKPGDPVRLDVRPASDGPSSTKTVTLGSREGVGCVRDLGDGGPCLGIETDTRAQKFDLPFDVKIDTRDIGGPSAGLAFALALLDQLTPGELTGGKTVAVTGTIDLNGFVGPVGGVRQKIAAVKAAGADVFLVPADEFETAKAVAGKKLQVFSVSTLEDALSALGRVGGDLAALSRMAGSPAN